jgi:hypothetical protein
MAIACRVTCCPKRRSESAASARKMLRNAALHEAKNGGRNRVVVIPVKPLMAVETPPQRGGAGR